MHRCTRDVLLYYNGVAAGARGFRHGGVSLQRAPRVRGAGDGVRGAGARDAAEPRARAGAPAAVLGASSGRLSSCGSGRSATMPACRRLTLSFQALFFLFQRAQVRLRLRSQGRVPFASLWQALITHVHHACPEHRPCSTPRCFDALCCCWSACMGRTALSSFAMQLPRHLVPHAACQAHDMSHRCFMAQWCSAVTSSVNLAPH